MINEAIQRSEARAAKELQTGVPQKWGSEEPFTYNPAVRRCRRRRNRELKPAGRRRILRVSAQARLGEFMKRVLLAAFAALLAALPIRADAQTRRGAGLLPQPSGGEPGRPAAQIL